LPSLNSFVGKSGWPIIRQYFNQKFESPMIVAAKTKGLIAEFFNSKNMQKLRDSEVGFG
jgi:hypothetical protein